VPISTQQAGGYIDADFLHPPTFPLQSDGGPYISASSNFPRTPPARMRLWSASAFDQIDGGITLHGVAA
jgi:hypothetical protein